LNKRNSISKYSNDVLVLNINKVDFKTTLKHFIVFKEVSIMLNHCHNIDYLGTNSI